MFLAGMEPLIRAAFESLAVPYEIGGVGDGIAATRDDPSNGNVDPGVLRAFEARERLLIRLTRVASALAASYRKWLVGNPD
jgi:hypothetical protein